MSCYASHPGGFSSTLFCGATEMVEVGANFCLTHVCRVTFVVEEDEVSDAVDVLLLGAVTQMATANSLSDRFEER